LLAINKPRKALPLLEKVQKKNPNNLQLATNIAKIHLERKNYEAAERQYITALAIDESNPMAHYGLGMTFLRRNLLNEALEEFLLSLELDFYFTNVHYHLGETLFKLGNLVDACKAFEVAIRLSPGMTKAHKWLVEIYENQLKNPEKAIESKKYLTDNIAGEISICTGVENGNYEPFFKLFKSLNLPFAQTEKLDESISNLHYSSEFLQEYIGKIIFIPSHRLSFLPVGLNYKLINLKIPTTQLIENLTVKKLNSMVENSVSSSIVELINKEETKIETWISTIPSLKVINFDWEEISENESEQCNILLEFLGFN
jgi:tetratricopeptide (TPR) repeat protein